MEKPNTQKHNYLISFFFLWGICAVIKVECRSMSVWLLSYHQDRIFLMRNSLLDKCAKTKILLRSPAVKVKVWFRHKSDLVEDWECLWLRFSGTMLAVGWWRTWTQVSSVRNRHFVFFHPLTVSTKDALTPHGCGCSGYVWVVLQWSAVSGWIEGQSFNPDLNPKSPKYSVLHPQLCVHVCE